MKVHIDSVSDVSKKLNIEVPEETFQSQIQRAYSKVIRSAQIPGFRKGKAPKSVIEKKYGKAIESEVYQDLIRDTVTQALEENDYHALNISDISEPKREEGKGFSYTASVEIKPKFEPKDYIGVKVKKSETKVEDKQVQDVLDRLLDQHSVLLPIEGKTSPEKGDHVSMMVEEVKEDGSSKCDHDHDHSHHSHAQEQIHLVGHADARKEVDEAILSMSIGDTQQITLSDEKDENKVYAKLTLNAIKKKELPTLDDAFAKTVGPFESLDALKKQINEDLKAEVAEKNKVEHARQLLEYLAKKNPVTLPDSLISAELASLRQGVFNRMIQSGMNSLPKDFSAEKMDEELKPEAQKRVHEELVLEAIAKKENIDVDAQEVAQKLEEYAGMMNKPVGEVRAEFEKSGKIQEIRYRILNQKTLDFLLDKANIA
ncbi:MAG: trigger factor [Bdellovibrionales bacterium]|nr:trigger factor [Bdellovibrionales bacterium]